MKSSRTTDKSNDAPQTDRMLLYAAVLVGAFLRLYRLGYQSIWGDESLTVQVYSAGRNFHELWSHIWARAFHPPLYFVLVHYWYLLGKSEFMLRFPSALFGIAAIPVVYLIARRLFGSRVGVISAFVVALSPFHIWYSQEARMYTLQVLLASASILFFVRAWDARFGRDIAAYGVTTALGLFTQISSGLLLASQGLLVLGASTRNWRKSAVWLGVQAVVLLAFMPWALHFLSARKHLGSEGSIGFQRETSPLHLAYALYTLNVGYSLGPSVSALHYLSPRTALGHHLPVIALTALVFGLLAVLGLVRAYRMNRFGFWVLITGLVVPVGLVGAASMVPGLPLNPRYVTVAVIPYWIILALGVELIARIRAGWLVPAGAVALIGVALFNHYYLPAYSKQDMRSATAVVNRLARPGDVVVISSIEEGGPFIYYFDRQGIPYVGYPPTPGLINQRRLPSDMRKILNHHKRVWLVLGRTWSSDPQGLLPRAFGSRYDLILDRRYQGTSVKCYVLSRSPDAWHINQ